MEQESKEEVPQTGVSNILEIPEVGLSTRLMREIREAVAKPEYDHLSTSELIGVLEMLKHEYLCKWLGVVTEDY
jgi:hypothetical protein